MTAGRPPFPEVDSQRFVLVPVKDRHGFPWVAMLALSAMGVMLLWATLVMRPSNNSNAGVGSLSMRESNANTSEPNSGPMSTLAAIEATRLATETMPTPTSTATATPVPTSTQVVVWQPEPCGSPEPGQLCRVPDRAPPTPTPYPSCYGTVEPGKWCRWWLMDDAPDGRSEVK